ncbi:histidine kinase [Peptoclostridium litorale DSM 5388]|uniref:histidine kinase n=1 Tax=Peptoclostridium litorale DSM 5388 TaxID=1121324 RepID=A0A069RFD1_PEPLI|nr:HAMP domain-containing sensor histidine kinase [Peptoclostridium litorale]KDR95498.1 sensor protein kinase WalK [Peptoclostridium litorale DSM 5388]SIO17410.1 histidine kinase [Peptoclostridium litorale DSM 5388]
MEKKRDRISGGTRKLRGKMFFMWMISLLIPIVILISYNYMLYGPKAFIFLTNPEFFNREIWQMERYNSSEYTSRYFNNLILENPDSVLNVKNHDVILNEDEIRRYEMIVLIRRNDQVISVNDLSTKAGKEVTEKMKGLGGDVLPKFKGGMETNNQELFVKTGYVVQRQTDFYFNDGDEGSIFILRKFTNIPGRISQAVMQNLILIIGMMALMQAFFSYRMSREITRPIDDIIQATNQVRDGNFSYRMKSRARGVLNELVLAINDMIVDLDAGRKYRRQIEKTRQEFLANLSHDLKTPMTSIKIHIDAIRDGVVSTPEKMDRYLSNIHRKVQDMDSMLEELKTFSELETGIGNYTFYNVNFNAVMEDIIDEFRYDIADSPIEIRYHADLPEGETVEVDVEKMKRVVLNIITNSIKYAKTETLVIDVNMKNTVYNEVPAVQLSIKDNGVGVPQDKLDRIFEKFYRADEARSHQQPGSGLGLAIAKTIVEQHGGSIEAISLPGEGLEIIITLQKI